MIWGCIEKVPILSHILFIYNRSFWFSWHNPVGSPTDDLLHHCWLRCIHKNGRGTWLFGLWPLLLLNRIIDNQRSLSGHLDILVSLFEKLIVEKLRLYSLLYYLFDQSFDQLDKIGPLAHKHLESVSKVIRKAKELHIVSVNDKCEKTCQVSWIMSEDLSPANLFDTALQHI